MIWRRKSKDKTKDEDKSALGDFGELAKIPLALAFVIAGITYAVWFYTTEPGQPESVRPTACRLTDLENCISPDVLNRMVNHGGIAGGFGSIWSYVMITRERRAREAAEQRAEAAERRVQEERQRADGERRDLMEQIRLLTARVVNGNGEEARPSSE